MKTIIEHTFTILTMIIYRIYKYNVSSTRAYFYQPYTLSLPRTLSKITRIESLLTYYYYRIKNIKNQINLKAKINK